MSQYDFDAVIDRRNTNAVEYTALRSLFGRDDLLPLWVAAMDFAAPDFIIDALRHRLEHPILGYTGEPEDYWPAIIDWILARHN